MKNLFFSFLAMLILSAGTNAFGQMTNTEILEMIQKSKEYNRDNAGVLDPGKIWPGQILTYFFEDGTSATIMVEKGDNQWTIVGEKLAKLREVHGEVVEPNQEILPQPKPVVQPEQEEEPTFFSRLWSLIVKLWYLTLFILVCLLALLFITYGERWRKSNPVTSGPAMIPGGVNDSSIRQTIGQRYPGATIKSIQKGRLYGKGTPYYNFKKVSFNRLTNNLFGKFFNGEVGYQAEIVTPNGQEMIVQTLAGCGNEIKMDGKFMTGLTFVPDQSQPETLIATPITPEVVVDELKKLVTEEKPVVKKREQQSDEVMIVNDQALATIEFLKTQQAHRVTMDYQKNADGSVSIKSVFETKNNPMAKKDESEKEN